MPHLDAAYGLARWLVRHDQDAEDVVQEAFLRALQFFRGFQGDSARAWLLQIVRNTCYTWLARHRAAPAATSAEMLEDVPAIETTPEAQFALKEDRQLLMRAIAALPVEFREAIVLRELEGLSYKEIARIAEIPLGTVMSRLARAREQLHELLGQQAQGECA